MAVFGARARAAPDAHRKVPTVRRTSLSSLHYVPGVREASGSFE